MYAEYIRLSKQYQELYGENTCVFLMVGKFYEMYDYKNPTTGECHTSMLRATDLLNIQLTIKPEGGPNNEEGYFAGVPEQSLHKYAGILTKNGWTVVVCNQKKNPAGTVTGRPVARILSPGTHFEANEFSSDAQYLACLWFEENGWSKGEPPSYGLVLFDLSTGNLIKYEGQTSGTSEVWSADTLNQIFQIYSPRELIFYWRGDEISKPKESQLRNRLNGFSGTIHIRSGSKESQGSFETPLVREEFIGKHFQEKVGGIIPVPHMLGLKDMPRVERALICLLRFVEEHIPSALENLGSITTWKEDDRVYLGNSALVQLNMTGQRPEDCVLGLFQKCITNQGKRAFKERLLTPLCDIDTLESRYDQVQELMDMKKENRQILEKYIKQIYDLPRLHRKIVTFTLQAMDVINLEQSYTAILFLLDYLKDTKFKQTEKFIQEIKEMREAFMSFFDGKKARESIENQDIKFLSQKFSPGTASIEEQIAVQRQEIEKKAKEICAWASINSEAIRIEVGKESQLYGYSCTNTTFNILKQVYSVKKESCPLKDLELTKKKASGGTLETNFLQQHNSKIIGLRVKLEEIFQKEYQCICNLYAYGDESESKGFHHMWSPLDDWVSEIDMSLSIAKTSEQNHYIRPTILESVDSAFVDIKGLRHPLIESLTTRIEYVKHNVRLDSKTNGWLVYGMNASGKSSLMKAVGVSVLLAQAGMYVPAQEFQFSPFRSILTRILNQDNLWAGLSSFAVEMCELRDILQNADPFSLVLGDELCSGTESISATALVASGIHTLLEKKSRFIFATHLHGLTEVDEIRNSGEELAIWHLKVHYDALRDCLVYDRTLQPGSGDSLYGLEVAKAIHLPIDFLERAYQIRHRLLGEGTQEFTKGSHWNRSIVLLECERCKKKVKKELEAHHIRERNEAKGKHFEDGSRRDDARNLVVLCETCHDDVHAGKVVIGPVKVTSRGPMRLIEEKEAPSDKTNDKTSEREESSSDKTTDDTKRSKKSNKFKEEEHKIIEAMLRKYPSATIKRIQNDLLQQHNITIHSNSLSAIRRKLKAEE